MSGERWDEITRWVDVDGRVSLGDLASRFGVSEMTIRRDLDALTDAGRLQRVRGGAVSLTAAPPVTSARAPVASTHPVAPAAPAGVEADVVADVAAGQSPSPADDPARAPSSLGSVIASWAGAFPSGFPSGPVVTASSRAHTAEPEDDLRPGARATPTPPADPRTRGVDLDDLDDLPEEWRTPVPGSAGASPRSPGPSGPSGPTTASTPAPREEDPWVRAAAAALGDLAPGSAVLLTGGTGSLALAHHLARTAVRTPTTALTVAVTAIAPATVLAGAPGVRLVVLGGEVEATGTELVGPAALAALEDLHLDVVVLTPTGLDARGAWAATSASAALVSAAAARAEQVVAVVAPAALGRPGLVRAAALGALSRVVAVPAPGEDTAALTARLEAVRAAAPSAPLVVAV